MDPVNIGADVEPPDADVETELENDHPAGRMRPRLVSVAVRVGVLAGMGLFVAETAPPTPGWPVTLM